VRGQGPCGGRRGLASSAEASDSRCIVLLGTRTVCPHHRLGAGPRWPLRTRAATQQKPLARASCVRRAWAGTDRALSWLVGCYSSTLSERYFESRSYCYVAHTSTLASYRAQFTPAGRAALQASRYFTWRLYARARPRGGPHAHARVWRGVKFSSLVRPVVGGEECGNANGAAAP
jgi:hypothetical protein